MNNLETSMRRTKNAHNTFNARRNCFVDLSDLRCAKNSRG